MDYSVLLDLYITKNVDKLIKDQDDTKEECKEDKQKINDLLEEKDRHLVSRYAQGLLNTIQLKYENRIIEALHLGFQIGMEIKQMLIKYEEC